MANEPKFQDDLFFALIFSFGGIPLGSIESIVGFIEHKMFGELI